MLSCKFRWKKLPRPTHWVHGASNKKTGILVGKVLGFCWFLGSLLLIVTEHSAIKHRLSILLCQFDRMVNPNHFLIVRAFSCTFTYYFMLELLSHSMSYSSISESKSHLLALLLPSLSLSVVYSISIDKSNLHAPTSSLFLLVGKSFWFDSVCFLTLAPNVPKFGLHLHRRNTVNTVRVRPRWGGLQPQT